MKCISCDHLALMYYPITATKKICLLFIGFTVDASKFFIFLLTLTLTSITATSQAFAVSSRLKVVAVANLLMALSLVLFIVCHFNTKVAYSISLAYTITPPNSYVLSPYLWFFNVASCIAMVAR